MGYRPPASQQANQEGFELGFEMRHQKLQLRSVREFGRNRTRNRTLLEADHQRMQIQQQLPAIAGSQHRQGRFQSQSHRRHPLGQFGFERQHLIRRQRDFEDRVQQTQQTPQQQLPAQGAAEQMCQLRAGPVGRGGQGLTDFCEPGFELCQQKFQKQRLLTGKIQIKRALGQTGCADDVQHPNLGVGQDFEQLPGSAEQMAAAQGLGCS